MTYDEIKKHAIAKCDEWFLSNPVYFHNKAKLIAERWEAYNKESARLNPQKMLNFCDPKTGIWYPEAPKHFAVVDYYFPERKEPSWIDPIWACVGKPVTKWNALKHCNENTTKTVLPSNKDDALLIYVAALLILHDGAAINGAGLEIITENIWSKEQSPILWASQFFETNDRTPFIEAALMHVETDLASKAVKEKTLNDSVTPPKTDADTKHPITLKSFIEIHCDLTARPDIHSKVALLYEYDREGKITLPKLAHKFKIGQHKYYFVEDLKKNWTVYQKKMPSLPPLKPPEVAGKWQAVAGKCRKPIDDILCRH